MSIDPLSTYFQTAINFGESKAGGIKLQGDPNKPSQIAPASSTTTSKSTHLSTSGSPCNFVIGTSTLAEPLVGIQVVQGHLQLLHAFSELKKTIVYLSFYSDFRGWKEDDKWRYFLGVAVERFDLWCQKLAATDLDIAWDVFLPPLDVLMVWHSYLLNPLWYAEDAQRIPRCRVLAHLGCHLVSALQSDRLLGLLTSASEERKSFWTGRTALEFDPEVCLKVYQNKSIKNLCCGQVDEIEFCNKAATGYLQGDFSHFCSNRLAHSSTVLPPGNPYDIPMKREMNAVQKLAKDLTKSTSTPGGYLAGSYLATSDPLPVREAGLKIKSSLISHIEADMKIGKIDDSERFLWEVSRSYALADIKKVIGDSALALRVLGAYADDKIYSVGLVDAVLRQGKFVDKMEELKWSVPNFLEKSDVRILPHAVARYHAFLDLMATHPGTMLVPTLDIDLVWHTHQLMYPTYGKDCVKYVGRFIDHDDKVEGTHLSHSFDQTGLLWKMRFNVPYTFCGCPTPGLKMKQRLSAIINRTSSQTSYSHLITPPVRQGESTLATHPSDHNAVRRENPYGANKDPTYLSAQQKKAKELKTNRSKLYEYHPHESYRNHPHQSTFLYPVVLVVGWSGLDAGHQCAGGYSDPYVPPNPPCGSSGDAGISGGTDHVSSCGGGGSSCGGGGGGCGGGCGGGGCGG